MTGIWRQDDGAYYALPAHTRTASAARTARALTTCFAQPTWRSGSISARCWRTKFSPSAARTRRCPVFWPLSRLDGSPSGKHMLLLFSHKRAGRCYIGDYDPSPAGSRPTPTIAMNYGSYTIGSLHAPSAAIGPDGLFTAIFNVKEGKPAAGWDQHHDAAAPILAARRRRARHDYRRRRRDAAPRLRRHPARDIPANQETLLDDIDGIDGPAHAIRGKAIEINAVIEPRNAREVGLYVLRSPDAAERTRISFYPQDNRRFDTGSLQIDISERLSAPTYSRGRPKPALRLYPGEPLRLRIFVDRSIIEVFANDRHASPCAPTRSVRTGPAYPYSRAAATPA